jgi:hypothetical protein
MMAAKPDAILLGHNQFIGVSHLSQDSARTRVERFSDYSKIAELVGYCAERGVSAMMLSTHPRARDILQILKDEGLASRMNLYPLIPYAAGYVRRMNAVGMKGMVKEIFSQASTSTKARIASQGALGYARKDFTRMLGAFIDIELLPFDGFNLGGVFLHDAFVDLALALDAGEQMEFFSRHIGRRYSTRAGFVTMNFPALAGALTRWDMEPPLVMTTFNKAGFQMNPSRESCEEALPSCRGDIIAMSTLAAGYLKPRDAYQYLFALDGIDSVVVGVSSTDHSCETIEEIERCRGARGAATP